MTRRLQISNVVHVQLSLEQIRVRLVTDRHKHARAIKDRLLTRLQIAKTNTSHTILRRAENLLNRRIPDKLDLLVFERLLLHDLRRAQLVATMNDVNFSGVARQKSGLFHRRIATANHHQSPVSKRGQRTIARRTRRNAVASKTIGHFCFAGMPSHFAEAPVAMIKVSVEIVPESV